MKDVAQLFAVDGPRMYSEVYYMVWNNGLVQGREVWVEDGKLLQGWFEVELPAFCSDEDVRNWHFATLPASFTYCGVEWRQPIERGV